MQLKTYKIYKIPLKLCYVKVNLYNVFITVGREGVILNGWWKIIPQFMQIIPQLSEYYFRKILPVDKIPTTINSQQARSIASWTFKVYIYLPPTSPIMPY